MTMYQYVAALSGWHVVAISAASDTSIQQRLDGWPRPKLILEMEAWCDNNYDSTKKAPTLAESHMQDTTWGYSFGDFYFKDENDAFLFVLRWTGEANA